jgi:anti-anti-sigma factor
MTLRTDCVGSFPCLRVRGRVVRIDSESFKEQLNELCELDPAEKIIVDFSHTEFIDSYGLGALIHYYNMLRGTGRELIVLNTNREPHAHLRRLFETTGLDQVLTVVDSECALA